MTEKQQIVFDWLIITTNLEGGCVVDHYAAIQQFADEKTMQAWFTLSPKEREKAVYLAMIEVDSEYLF